MKIKRNALSSLCLLLCLLLALSGIALADGETDGGDDSTDGGTGTASSGLTPPEFQYGSLEDVFSVSLPAVHDGMLDFTVDPQSLISRTGAERYGNVPVERGATLLFTNSNGGFSSRSDALTVSNNGACPVVVTIWISVQTASGVSLTRDRSFSGDRTPSVYLALTDSEGAEYPTSVGSYVYSSVVIPVGASPYSFGLRGASNPYGDWRFVGSEPMRVSVSWEVEPILPELFQTESAEDAEGAETGETGETGENAENGEAGEGAENGEHTEATPGSLTVINGGEGSGEGG